MLRKTGNRKDMNHHVIKMHIIFHVNFHKQTPNYFLKTAEIELELKLHRWERSYGNETDLFTY